jgi:hypothetical protein
MPEPQGAAFAIIAVFVLYMAITLYHGRGSLARAYRKWGIPAHVRRGIAVSMMVVVGLGIVGALAADLGIFPASPVGG